MGSASSEIICRDVLFIELIHEVNNENSLFECFLALISFHVINSYLQFVVICYIVRY